MPELPEVENVCIAFRDALRGRTIDMILIDRESCVKYPTVQGFIAGCTGRIIRDMTRYGKYMVLTLDDDSHIVLHFMLTGYYRLDDDIRGYASESVTFILDKQVLHFADARGFSRVWYYGPNEDFKACGIYKLGPEPTSKEFTRDYLKRILEANFDKPIKQLLLEQELISGIGNIYGDEILFDAGILPTAHYSSFEDKVGTLYNSINSIIEWAVRTNAITIETYTIGGGHVFPTQPFLNVYGREGQPCNKCGSIIQSIKINGRTSCYCPKCQS